MGVTTDLKAAVKLSDWVAERTEVKPTRRPDKYLALCPKHDDHKPSLEVDDKAGKDGTGLFFCRVCRVGGDIFSWLSWTEGLEFEEALERVVDRVGYRGKRTDVAEANRRREQRRVYEIMEDATVWLKGQLAESHIEMLARRYNLSVATIKAAEIGFGGGQFHAAMNAAGHTDGDLVRCGLLERSDDGRLYFPLENRIVLPFREHGHIVYMTGRHMQEDVKRPQAKYRHLSYGNPNVSEFIHKSMYGIDTVFGAEKVYLVEGPMDALAIQEREGLLGEKLAAVAVMGSALNAEQAMILRNLTRGMDITILADGDDAGIQGALTSAGLLASAGSLPWIQVVPNGDDPASMGDRITELPAAISPIDLWCSILPTMSPNRQTDAFNEKVLPLLAAYPAMQRDPAINQIAQVLGNNAGTIRSALSKYMVDSPAGPSTRFNLTDVGNAQRMAMQFGHNIHYTWPSGISRGTWWVWSDKRWEVDRVGTVHQMAKATVNAMLVEAAKMEGPERKQLTKWAMRCESEARRKTMLSTLQSEEGIPILPEQFDNDPWILNTLDGILDLKTLEMMPHQRERLCAKLAPVHYIAKAGCPKWQEFIDRVTGGNIELQYYLQKAVGYTMTGDTGEQVFFLLHGTGANGKSTFLGVVQHLLGDYAKKTSFDTFMLKKGDSGPRDDVAGLSGARMVISVEAQQGKRLDESLIKELTGNDAVTARFLYESEFTFVPQFKLWLAANDKPTITGTDMGIWRRVKLIPFTVCIPEADRDPDLKDKLIEELPGIFAWAMEGLAMWRAEGLGECEAIQAATGEYRDESDIIGEFINDCLTLNPNAYTLMRIVYGQYVAWATENHIHPYSNPRFNEELKKKGFQTIRHGKGGRTCWIGIGDPEPRQDEMEMM